MSSSSNETASANEILAFAKALEAKARHEMIRLEAKSESVVKSSNAALALQLQYEFAKQAYQGAGYLIDMVICYIKLEQEFVNISLVNQTPLEQCLKSTIEFQRKRIKTLEESLQTQRYQFNETLDDLNITR